MTSRARAGFRPLAIAIAALIAFASVLVGVAAPASADVTGQISGKVTGDDAPGGIGGVVVRFYDSVGGAAHGQTTTASNGTYISPDLAAGNYAVWFDTTGVGSPVGKYVAEFYNNAFIYEAATVVVVTGGSVTTNVSSLLTSGAKLTGTVTGQLGLHTVGEWSAYLQNTTNPSLYRIIDIPANGKWTINGIPPGTYRLRYDDGMDDPNVSYRMMFHNQKLLFADADPITIVGTTPQAVTAKLSIAGPMLPHRISGATRYDTAVAVSGNYSSKNFGAGTYAYVANGQNYPDALSAAPAAAHRAAPLLLTPAGSLPAAVKAELIRLKPKNIIVVGGTGAVSNAVFNQIQAISNQTTVTRIGGADRYATSRALVEEAWNGQTAAKAFIATGTNYPDALSAASAAGKLGGPVILVPGNATTATAGTKTLLGTLHTNGVYIAGGSAVVSNGIQSSIDALPGISVTRLGGVDRYDTSFIINNTFFTSISVVYLATGTGYADALAGAAFTGAEAIPLFTVKPDCVPVPMLHKFALLEATDYDLLGGTGALSAKVYALDACPYTPVPAP